MEAEHERKQLALKQQYSIPKEALSIYAKKPKADVERDTRFSVPMKSLKHIEMKNLSDQLLESMSKKSLQELMSSDDFESLFSNSRPSSSNSSAFCSPRNSHRPSTYFPPQSPKNSSSKPNTPKSSSKLSRTVSSSGNLTSSPSTGPAVNKSVNSSGDWDDLIHRLNTHSKKFDLRMEVLREEQQKKEQLDLTHHPKISEVSMRLAGGKSNFFSNVGNLSPKKGEEFDVKEKKEFTFSPRITKKSKSLAKIITTPFLERVKIDLENKKIREEENKRKKMEALLKELEK